MLLLKKIVPSIFLFSAIYIITAQVPKKFNLDFEDKRPDKSLPEGWIKWGYYPLITDTVCHSGNFSGKISAPSNNTSFGSIAYRFPAKYRGSRIRLEGYMKIENVQEGFAGLLMRVDGNSEPLAFDNMKGQEIKGTVDWKKYSVGLDYPNGARWIYVAGILVGKGTVWVDDFVVTIDGKDVQTLEETDFDLAPAEQDLTFSAGSSISLQEFNNDKIRDLALLGKVWGFLKYHHPSIAEGNLNWDNELFRILPSYMKSTDSKERDILLGQWIEKLGNIPSCDSCDQNPEGVAMEPDHDWINNTPISRELKSHLQRIYDNRNQGENYYVRLARGVGNPIFQNESPNNHMPYPDDGYRLLALFRYWNMIQYFYPYRNLIESDWDEVLELYIPEFINAKTELEYELTALKLIALVGDSHANLWGGADQIDSLRGELYAPVKLGFIGNDLVVTDYYNPEFKEQTRLDIGDVITKVNGRDVEKIVDSITDYYPASNNSARLRDIARDMLRSRNSTIQIAFRRASVDSIAEVKLYHRDYLNIYRQPSVDSAKCYKFLENGQIGYISLATIKEKDIDSVRTLFKDTKGIVVDIRNYPSFFVPFLLGTYFVSQETPFAKFTHGNINNPGEFLWTDNLKLIPDATYKGKVIVLVNEITQSQAEYTTMAFQAGKNTTVIGNTTAGADGNISNIDLPGGLRTWISGIGVYYPDGTDTQKVGIIPDIEVWPTIKGIRDGRDELLERAIQEILH